MTDKIQDFFDAWGMSGDQSRQAAINASVSPDVIYCDPRTPEPICGPGPLADYLSMFSQAAPGASAKVVKSDTSHAHARVTVAFRMADGMEQLGQYFVQTDDAGNITAMSGFVGTGAPE